MKTDACIIKNGDNFFGFLPDFPAICAQSDSADNVLASLKKCAQLYFSFMSKNELEISLNDPISL